MIKTIAIFIVFAVIGGAAVLLLSPTASFATSQLTTLITPLQSTVNRIQTMWSTIPGAIQGIILLAIPTAAATFFAWTKGRAMEKLQQTQQQAATQIGELQGETLNAVKENTTLQATNEQLQQQVTTMQTAQTNAATLTTKIDSLKAENLRLQGSVTQMERQFANKYLKPEEKPKIE